MPTQSTANLAVVRQQTDRHTDSHPLQLGRTRDAYDQRKGWTGGTPIQWRHLGREKPTVRGLRLRDEEKRPDAPCASETTYPGGFM